MLSRARTASSRVVLSLEELPDGPIGLPDGVAVLSRAREIGVSKRYMAEGTVTQHVTWSGLAVHAKEEPWLRVHVRVPPPIEHDPGDVAVRGEPTGSRDG